MKKYISSLIISFFIFMQFNCVLPCFADNSVFSGHAEVTDVIEKQEDDIFTDEQVQLTEDNTINLTVSQVLNGTISQEGDEFFAEVTTDVLAESGILLPVGTIAHGRIKNIGASKSLGRDGWIELSFDSLITPDGREIPIEGGMSTKMHPAKATAKTIAKDVGYTAMGGVIGGYTALSFLGLEGAIVSQGYTILGGAAIGGVIALGMSLFRKGKDALISPGDEIKIRIKSNTKIPVMKKEALQQHEIFYEGLDVQINDIWLEKDPFDNLNTIVLDVIIKNMTNKTFSCFDIVLTSDLNESFRTSIFTEYQNSLAFTKIKPNESVSGILAFSVNSTQRKFWLNFNDRQTRKPLAKISINNSMEKLNIKTLSKKKKKKK